eukprot:4410885-Pyramimonas_sp.AAC.1
MTISKSIPSFVDQQIHLLEREKVLSESLAFTIANAAWAISKLHNLRASAWLSTGLETLVG